jgi:signal transduction histidine kinase
MTATARRKQESGNSFEKEYARALSEYAMRGGEGTLRKAYELGREAAVAGKSLLEIASFHHRALAAIFKKAIRNGSSDRLLAASAEFLAEAISPYEMAHRGFRDSVRALQKLNQTLEEEIKRIAHGVHDEAGQLLIAVHFALAEFAQSLPKEQREPLARIEELLNQAENQLRRYSHELRPTMLDDLGWIPAIRFLAEATSKRSGLPIQVKVSTEERPPGAVEIALYRIVQEALTNIHKHAQASRALIRVHREGTALCCSVEDDGKGFDVLAAGSDSQRHGLGLVGMHERMTAIGGSLKIDSSPGRGTAVHMRVPMKKAANDGN